MTTTPIAAARVSGTIDRIARELCVSENEIWDEATQGYRDRWHEEAARILAAIQPDPEPQPVAWMHTMHYEAGCGENVSVTLDPDHPFGTPGRDFDADYAITSQPLFATPSSAGTVSVEAAAGVLLEAKQKHMSEGGGSKYLSYIDGVALRALAGDQS